MDLNGISKNKVLVSLIVLAVLTRLIPHPPNIAPITGIALFGGSRFNNKWIGFGLPLLCMFISDLFLGFSSITMFVYLSFMMISYIGINSKTITNGTILGSSLLFFLLTNLGVFLLGYPHTIQGLITCYTLALPFLVNTIIGDLFFTHSLSYSFEKVKQLGVVRG
jgi:hypothetical protein|tara:strand:+ start:1935 stop:2429 length:495 start_codon:yes stop_codon:yes gene_type:complete